MMFVSVQISGRCEKCGQSISTDTVMHGRLDGQPFCMGKIAGRTMANVWLASPITLKRTGALVPSPWRGRKATPAERRTLAPLIAEVRTTGKSIHDRPTETIS